MSHPNTRLRAPMAKSHHRRKAVGRRAAKTASESLRIRYFRGRAGDPSGSSRRAFPHGSHFRAQTLRRLPVELHRLRVYHDPIVIACPGNGHVLIENVLEDFLQSSLQGITPAASTRALEHEGVPRRETVRTEERTRPASVGS